MCNTGIRIRHHPNSGLCRGGRRRVSCLPSLPQARVLGEERDVPHLVLAEVGRQALLPVLPDVDGAREEVLVHGDDGRGLVAPPLVAAGRNPESQPASLALFRSVSHCSTWAGHPVVNRTAVKPGGSHWGNFHLVRFALRQLRQLRSIFPGKVQSVSWGPNHGAKIVILRATMT